MKTRIFSIYFILFIFSALVTLWAMNPTYRMTLTVQTENMEEYSLVVELDERQFTAIKNDPNFGVQPFLVQARKEYADKIGYRKEIYGEDNYKMVVISRYSLVIRDISQERVVFSKK